MVGIGRALVRLARTIARGTVLVVGGAVVAVVAYAAFVGLVGLVAMSLED